MVSHPLYKGLGGVTTFTFDAHQHTHKRFSCGMWRLKSKKSIVKLKRVARCHTTLQYNDATSSPLRVFIYKRTPTHAQKTPKLWVPSWQRETRWERRAFTRTRRRLSLRSQDHPQCCALRAVWPGWRQDIFTIRAQLVVYQPLLKSERVSRPARPSEVNTIFHLPLAIEDYHSVLQWLQEVLGSAQWLCEKTIDVKWWT